LAGVSHACETDELFRRLGENDDQAARDELTARYLPLALRLARRFARRGEPLDDLSQVAALGLVKALDRFDPSLGTAFTTYAVPSIVGELKRHFRDFGWATRVPRSLQERSLRVNHAVSEFSREHGRSPSVKELSTALDSTPEEVVEAIEAYRSYAAVSLEAQVGGEDGEGDSYLDSLGEEDGHYARVEVSASVNAAMRTLRPRERLVLHLRFAEDMTQSEIAERVGVSQMHVSRLIRRALERLEPVVGPR